MNESDSIHGNSTIEIEEKPPSAELRPAPNLTFPELLLLVARRRRLVGLVTLTAMLSGVIISLLLPVRYTATTQLLTPLPAPSAAMMINQIYNAANSSAAALTASGISLRNPNEVYIGMLTSRPVADDIIQKYGLEALYHAKDMTGARKGLAHNTKITAEKTTFISISVTDGDKQRAADLANAYTAELRGLTQSLAATEAAQRKAFYEVQVKEAKESLIAAEIAFQHVQQSKGMIQPQDQARAMIGNLAALRAQATAKSVELQALRSYSTDRNPQVELTENELASLQSAIARLGEKQHISGFSDLALGDVPAAGIDYLSAEHEMVYRQVLFDLLIKQYEAAKLDEVKQSMIIQVVEPAIPPDRKSSPHRTLIVLIFTLLGFLAACGYLYAADSLRKNPSAHHFVSELRSALTAE